MKPLVLLSLILMFSCKAQQSTGEPIEGLKLLERDNYGPGVEFEARTIKDQKSLNQFYSLVNRTRKPGLVVPQVDFQREMVLLIQLGTQQGEKALELSKSAESENELTVLVELKSGKNTDRTIQQPFYLYKMPITDKTVVFREIDRS